MKPRVTSLYRYGIRAVVPTIFCGIITAGVASVMNSNRMLNVGLGVFVAGFVVWGFACGTAVTWAAIETIRETGIRPFLRDCAKTPVVSAVAIMEILLYSIFGFGGVWLILKIAGIIK